MTPDDTTPGEVDDVLVLHDLRLTSDDLAGHTIDELTDYFDAGLMPRDASIDTSAGCQIVLAAIAQLRELTARLVEDDSAAVQPVDEGWITGILNQISVQARAGRDVPVLNTPDGGAVVITEGAVRALVRSAGDRVEGVFVGRCRFTGDVTVPGEPIDVEVEASVLWGQNLQQSAELVRQSILDEVRRHTPLNIAAVNVTVHDVRRPAGHGQVDAP